MSFRRLRLYCNKTKHLGGAYPAHPRIRALDLLPEVVKTNMSTTPTTNSVDTTIENTVCGSLSNVHARLVPQPNLPRETSWWPKGIG
jgi:hypothetical protein